MSEKRFTKCCPKMRDNGEEMNCQEIEDMLNKLYEENEQLKDALNQRTEQCDKLHEENTHIKTTLNNMIQSERTELGRSVLKQFKEQIK